MAGFANQLSTWAADFAPRIWATFLRGPPKAFNPTYLTATNWMKRWKEVEREENAKGNWGFGKAYNKARMETVMRKGTYVGTDYNGNKYYEDKNAPYGRTRWVEYPIPAGTWAIEQCYDGSMVSPEWHGWLHYTHDKTGPVMVAEYEKPFKMAHKINQSMQRPEFTEEFDFRVPQTKIDNSGFHQPPGSIGQRIARGRVGPKYESWSESPQSANPALRNYADNSTTLHIP